MEGVGPLHILLCLLLVSPLADCGSGDTKVGFYQVSPGTSAGNPSFITSEVVNEGSVGKWGVTVCAYVKLHYYRRGELLLSASSVGEFNGTLDATVGVSEDGTVLLKDGLNIINCEKKGTTTNNTCETVRLPLLHWHHVCLLVNEVSLQLFVNGVMIQSHLLSLSIGDKFRVSVGGWKQWNTQEVGGDVEHVGSFVGEITNLNVWSQMMTKENIEFLANCQRLQVLPVITSWAIIGSSITKLEQEETVPCREKIFDYVVIPQTITFDANDIICRRYGMNTVEPVLNEQYGALYSLLSSYGNFCGKDGVAGWLKPVEGVTSKCRGIAELGEQTIDCLSKVCGLCQLSGNRPVFYLRGMCSIEMADLSFVVGKDEKGTLYFQGMMGHAIVQNNNIWTLKTSLTGTDIAELNASNPVGTHYWTIKASIWGKTVGSTTRIAFNECSKDKSWCRSGACINSNQRCNGMIDCDDGSDEEDCHSLSMGRLESMIMRPLPRPSVTVSIGVVILRVLQERDDTPLQIVIRTSIIWNDINNTFANLRSNSLTRISPSADIWIPTLLPQGAPVDAKDCIGAECDEPFVVTAFTADPPLPDDREQHGGDLLYRNVTLQLTRLSVHSPDCSGQLITFFPFEEHICELHFQPETPQLRMSSLGATHPATHTPNFILEYVTLSLQEVSINRMSVSRAVLKLHFKRMNGFYSVIIFLPSSLLLFILSITLWVPDSCEFRLYLTVFVTVAFMLQSLIIAVNGPKTSTIRAIDVWMCFCIAHALFHVFVQVIIKALLMKCDRDGRTPRPISGLSSRPMSRLRQVKPLETTNLYDTLLAKLASEENEKTWTLAYWVMLSARVVSPTLTIVFMVAYTPFVYFYTSLSLKMR